MSSLFNPVGMVAHAATMIGFLVLAILLLRRPHPGTPALMLILAALLTAAWGGAVVLTSRFDGAYADIVSPMETLRTGGWIGFLVVVLAPSWRRDGNLSLSFLAAVAMGFIFAAQLLMDAAVWLGWSDWPVLHHPTIAFLFLLARMICSIGGLVLVHNFYVNVRTEYRWGIRLLCVALGGLFAYDLNLYTLATLNGSLNRDLFSARGAVNALIAPLIALSAGRNTRWQVDFKLSRHMVFQSVSLVSIGGYLVLMSLLAYAMRLVGGDWGQLLQVSAVFGALIMALVLASSGKVRAFVRVKINKHFFAYKYDYRAEWLRFIATLSGTTVTGVVLDGADQPLGQRIAKAICDIVDSPGGVLWTPDEDQSFTPAARWNFRIGEEGAEDRDSPLVRFLATRRRILDFDQLRRGEGDYGSLPLPRWAQAEERVWLAVPLLHQERLVAFLVVQRARATRSLNWEDFDLLRTVGQQAASYLAEQAGQTALIEARQFEEFNRRFAFIMHDIKNLVSQLSLVARNAERFGDRADFQKDMVLTIRDSVGKMNDLLARLQQHHGGKTVREWVDLRGAVEKVVRDKQAAHPMLSLSCEGLDHDHAPGILTDAARFEQILAHLVQNAIDASSADQPVGVGLVVEGPETARRARISIWDQGCGMSEEFVRHELFRPFRSTKAHGFGIGALEARDFVRDMGGRLEVQSRLGEGAIFTLLLPLTAEKSA